MAMLSWLRDAAMRSRLRNAATLAWVGAMLVVTAAPARAATVCPASDAAAFAAFDAPAPSEQAALVLLGCDNHLARVRALAALGDAAALSAAAAAAIVAHLSDPAEVVREEAMIAVLRGADAVRPALLAAMAADDAGSDEAAAALAVIGQGDSPAPVGPESRWWWLLDPARGRSIGEVSASSENAGLASESRASRLSAAADLCPRPADRKSVV